MSLRGLTVGTYGIDIVITVLDCDSGDPVDVSSYSPTFLVRSPQGKTTEVQGTFVTDGTDGQIRMRIPQGLIDLPGSWFMQVRLEGVGSQLRTIPELFDVEEAL